MAGEVLVGGGVGVHIDDFGWHVSSSDRVQVVTGNRPSLNYLEQFGVSQHDPLAYFSETVIQAFLKIQSDQYHHGDAELDQMINHELGDVSAWENIVVLDNEKDVVKMTEMLSISKVLGHMWEGRIRMMGNQPFENNDIVGRDSTVSVQLSDGRFALMNKPKNIDEAVTMLKLHLGAGKVTVNQAVSAGRFDRQGLPVIAVTNERLLVDEYLAERQLLPVERIMGEILDNGLIVCGAAPLSEKFYHDLTLRRWLSESEKTFLRGTISEESLDRVIQEVRGKYEKGDRYSMLWEKMMLKIFHLHADKMGERVLQPKSFLTKKKETFPPHEDTPEQVKQREMLHKLDFDMRHFGHVPTRVLMEFVEPGQTFVELGCGTGNRLKYLQLDVEEGRGINADQWTRIGVDFRGDQIEDGMTNYMFFQGVPFDLQLYEGDVVHDDLSEVIGGRQADLVFAEGLFGTLLDDHADVVMQRISKELLKPGGQLVIFDGLIFDERAIEDFQYEWDKWRLKKDIYSTWQDRYQQGAYLGKGVFPVYEREYSSIYNKWGPMEDRQVVMYGRHYDRDEIRAMAEAAGLIVEGFLPFNGGLPGGYVDEEDVMAYSAPEFKSSFLLVLRKPTVEELPVVKQLLVVGELPVVM